MRRVRKNKLEWAATAGNRDGFWAALENGTWEPQTFDILDACLDAETTFFDIGAWIGPTTLYGAQIARLTYSLEPDPVAHAELLENVDLNSESSWADSIVVINGAVAPRNGDTEIGSLGQPGDSMSSALFANLGGPTWSVLGVTLESMIGMEAGRKLIKIDIEGGEYAIAEDILKAADNPDVSIMISMHLPFFEKTGGDVGCHEWFLAELQQKKRVFIV